MKETTEYQAGAAIVSDGIKFKVPLFLGLKTTLCIKPLKPGTIVRIGMLETQLQQLEKDTNIAHELLLKANNLKLVAEMVAHSIINRDLFKRWKFRYYRWLLLDRIEDLAHLYSYQLIVQKQMDAGRFFFIMESTTAMNHLKKKVPENSEAGIASGEPSPLSKKPSD